MSNKASLALCLLMTICVVQVFTGCTDKLPDCKSYGKSACVAPYVTWAKENCKKFCGFCVVEKKKKKACEDFYDSHGKSYDVGDVFINGCELSHCHKGGAITFKGLFDCPRYFDLPEGCSWVNSLEGCCGEPACLKGHAKINYPAGWKKVPKRYELVKHYSEEEESTYVIGK